MNHLTPVIYKLAADRSDGILTYALKNQGIDAGEIQLAGVTQQVRWIQATDGEVV